MSVQVVGSKPTVKEYVVGFMFNNSHRKVCLIRKKRPDWQANKLNGIGGKVEPWETDLAGMVREFEEETSVKTTEGDWLHVCDIMFSGIVVHIYACANQTYFDAVITNTDEEVEKTTLHYIHSRQSDCIPNIPPLIRLCEHAIHFTDSNPYNKSYIK